MHLQSSAPVPALARKHLPIGIQTFAKLRAQDCYYVDKTGYLLDLIDCGGYYFLSRPRRFGKSLLLDTIKELFEGNWALFTGLQAEHRWDWSKRYPVIVISLSDGVVQNRAELEQRIQQQLRLNREILALPRAAELPASDTAGDLSELIRQAHQATGQRAVGTHRRVRQTAAGQHQQPPGSHRAA